MDRVTAPAPRTSRGLQLEHVCDIAAPVAAVWDVVSDIPGWPAWTPTVSAAVQLTPGPVASGTVFLLRQPLQRGAVADHGLGSRARLRLGPR